MDKIVKLVKNQIAQALVNANEEFDKFNAMFDDERRTTEEKIGIFREICENKGKIDALKDLYNFIRNYPLMDSGVKKKSLLIYCYSCFFYS